MTILRLWAALLSVLLGVTACIRRKQPLFFKILLFGCASYLVGAVFEACFTLVYGQPPAGFHVGYLGYAGAYFFLLSAYFGAINRLADGGEPRYRRHRLGALAGTLALAGATVWSVMQSGLSALPSLLLLMPISLTLYFALKLLILPDVEMGIIRVMRPYNACIISLCLCEALGRSAQIPLWAQTAAQCAVCLLLVLSLPLAQKGVRKWYI